MVGCQIFASHVDYLVCIFPLGLLFAYTLSVLWIGFMICRFLQFHLQNATYGGYRGLGASYYGFGDFSPSSSLGGGAGWCAGGPHTCMWDSSLA